MYRIVQVVKQTITKHELCKLKQNIIHVAKNESTVVDKT